MSNDKRLGVNPLSWVDPKGGAERQKAPISAGGQSAGKPLVILDRDKAPYAQPSGILTPSSMITKEDFMGKDKIKIKQTMDAAQVIALLEDLATSLGAGVIRAENGKDSVVLCTGEIIQFEMKLSRKKDKAKCSIEMEWEDDGSRVDAFRISNE